MPASTNKPKDPRRAKIPVEEIMRRYRKGESLKDLAHCYCLHPFSLKQRLKKDGYLLG